MAIYKAILFYGHSNFSLGILEYCPQEQCLAREQHYLDTLEQHEYNILKTAGSPLGHKHSEAARQKMSEACLAYYTENPEARTVAIAAANAARSKAVFVTNIETNETVSYVSQNAAARELKVSRAAIQKCLKSKNLLRQIYRIIRLKSSD